MFHYDLAIIGGGPAGLAAANMALNLRVNFVIVSPTIGGKVNYGFAMKDLEADDAIWGTESVREIEVRVKAHPECHIKKRVSNVVKEENGLFRLSLVGAQGIEQSIRATTVIVATGAQPQKLHLKGEKEYWGRGISYSTVSHAGLMAGRDVAVIGLGLRAVTAALRLSTIANHVYLIPKMALPKADSRVEKVRNSPNISLLIGWSPAHFSGNEFLKQLQLSHEYEFKTLDIDAAFVELGLLPDKDFLRGLVSFDPETGQIPINQLCETETPGLYAAGDVTDIFAEQIPVAIGEGVKAALSAWEYVASYQLELEPESELVA